MLINFWKYQGSGNDFVIIDNRHDQIILTQQQIKILCNRHFGIGADGLMLLKKYPNLNFEMDYYNSDGNPSSMCGNGGRCIVKFAKDLGIIENEANFNAADGFHYAKLTDQDLVWLSMNDVKGIVEKEDYMFLNTGSPHHIVFVENLSKVNVREEGAKIRHSNLYGKKGSNVNFVEKISSDKIFVRTFERGVENETLACGTGVTAAAIASYKKGIVQSNNIDIQTLGGDLNVCFENVSENFYSKIVLSGDAKKVFSGSIEI